MQLIDIIRAIEAEKMAAKKFPTYALRLEIEKRYKGNDLDSEIDKIKDQIIIGKTINQKFYKTKI